MKKFFLAYIFSISSIGIAAATPGTDLASRNGFTGCNTAIQQTFSEFDSSPGKRMRIDSFNTNNTSISLTATFGDANDTMFQKVIFEKRGNQCFTYGTLITYMSDSCTEYIKRTPFLKVQKRKGESDIEWAATDKPGVTVFIKTLPHGGCSAIMQLGEIYPVD